MFTLLQKKFELPDQVVARAHSKTRKCRWRLYPPPLPCLSETATSDTSIDNTTNNQTSDYVPYNQIHLWQLVMSNMCQIASAFFILFIKKNDYTPSSQMHCDILWFVMSDIYQIARRDFHISHAFLMNIIKW